MKGFRNEADETVYQKRTINLYSIKGWIQQQDLLVFVLLAFGFSWLVEVPLALQSQGLISWQLPYSLHYLSSYGPLLSALLVTWVSQGKEGLKEAGKGLINWRVKWFWWLAALSPLIMYSLAVLIQVSLGMPMTGSTQLGQVEFLPPMGVLALPLWILTFGLGEEIGWRGFALPRLQNNRTALRATILLWGIWALWHLPLFFYSYSLSILPGFTFGLLAGSIVFTWLYNSSGGSVLLTVIWHGLFNFTTACTCCKSGFIAAFISSLVMAGAVIVVLVYKPKDLSRFGKQVVGPGYNYS